MKFLCWSLVLLLTLLTVSAQNIKDYTAQYDLVLDKAIVDVTVTFENFHSQVEWNLPKDAVAIEVPGGADFEVIPSENSQKIVVKGNLFNEIKLKYITSSVIEKTKDRFFILDVSSIPAESYFITVKLPENADLKYTIDDPQPSIIPKAKELKTDGQRIIITWDSEDVQKAKSLLVIYTLPEKINVVMVGMIVAGFGVVILVGGVIYYLQRRKRKSHQKTIIKPKKEKISKPTQTAPEKNPSADLTKNLFEDEKKIVEILLESKGNELWQKELAHKSGLSKVKLSRKIRNLEQKGLIEKIPYGNTNKIRVKGG